MTVPDLFQTICTRSARSTPARRTLSGIGRPIKIVDGGEPVKELLG